MPAGSCQPGVRGASPEPALGLGPYRRLDLVGLRPCRLRDRCLRSADRRLEGRGRLMRAWNSMRWSKPCTNEDSSIAAAWCIAGPAKLRSGGVRDADLGRLFNHRRLPEPAIAARLKPNGLRRNRGPSLSLQVNDRFSICDGGLIRSGRNEHSLQPHSCACLPGKEAPRCLCSLHWRCRTGLWWSCSSEDRLAGYIAASRVLHLAGFLEAPAWALSGCQRLRPTLLRIAG